MKVPSTEIQNNFGKYLNIACEDQQVIVTKNGKEVAQITQYSDEDIIKENTTAYGERHGITYEQFRELTKNTDLRYELIDGEVFNLGSPNYFHQAAVGEIYAHIYNWLKGKKCRALTAPFDIILSKTLDNISVVQPDIIVICDTESIDEKGKYKGVPTLLVEILSPSTRKNDMIKKIDLYMQTKVQEYWIVDTEKKEVYVYTFEKQNILDYKVYINDATVKSDTFKGLEIKLKDIFT